MFCNFCKEILPEDDSICANKICKFLNEKLKFYGTLQFYLIVYSAFEKYDELLDNMKKGI
tara:strand:+ start:253 stop:432 length:180 start_codon:yes stop_codon:yes gene_type:complete